MALTKEQIAQRIAKELKDGYYVNLGIGIPTLVRTRSSSANCLAAKWKLNWCHKALSLHDASLQDTECLQSTHLQV